MQWVATSGEGTLIVEKQNKENGDSQISNSILFFFNKNRHVHFNAKKVLTEQN
jgi:hypothetical protein